MRIVAAAALLLAGTTMAFAEKQRDLGAHEHGVGQLNIAIEGSEIAMELTAPGADIVGFEHPAATEKDRARIGAAIEALKKAQDLFRLTDSAQCNVISAEAELLAADEGSHEEHDHADHHEKHGHHDDHHGADRDDEHDGRAHTEFRAEYAFSCAAPAQIREIEFGYFDTFPNAQELEVQLISDLGSRGFEVMRDAPVLDLEGAI